MVMEKYVCAFRGRRDSYQVPLALAEAGLLDQFITDAYATRLVRFVAAIATEGIRAKIQFRSEPGIPVERVRCLWGTTAMEHLRHRMGFAAKVTFNKLDRNFSRAAAERAEQARSNLFLYSPYAWEAFTARYSHTPRKVLFQYHPHPEMERRILGEDAVRHPGFGESFSGPGGEELGEEFVRRERDAWKHADLIFCASTFTKRSLIEAGCEESKCIIAPYGIDPPPVVVGAAPAQAFHVLLVGSGGQRKGLHHLLLAWQRAELPVDSKLTLVCRVIDREIEKLAATTRRVEIIRGLPQTKLDLLYAQSSLFAMPSLVEGFGQVYLEALAQGCPVLGTPHTCLPDLGGEADGVFTVAPGNVDELAATFTRLGRMLPGNGGIRQAARVCSGRFTWSTFRSAIREALE